MTQGEVNVFSHLKMFGICQYFEGTLLNCRNGIAGFLFFVTQINVYLITRHDIAYKYGTVLYYNEYSWPTQMTKSFIKRNDQSAHTDLVSVQNL